MINFITAGQAAELLSILGQWQTIDEFAAALADMVHTDEGPAFEEFWKLYPIKRGKPACIKYWNQMSGDDRRTAIRNLPAYKRYCEVTSRMMLDPQGYLNPAKDKRKFENEYPTIEEAREWADELIALFDTYWAPKFGPYVAPATEEVAIDIYRLRCQFADVELKHLKGVAHHIIEAWAAAQNTNLSPYIRPQAVCDPKKWPERKAAAMKFYLKHQ